MGTERMFNNKLAKAISDLACSVDGLRESLCAHADDGPSQETQIILKRMEEMENKIMSKISDWAANVGPKLDSIQTGLDAVQALVEQLQNSAGEITPEDQALLDQIETKVNALAADASSVPAPPAPTA
jgi:hypothetical protein